MFKIPLLTAALLAPLAPLDCTGISIVGGRCDETEPRNASIDASGVSEIEVHAAAGHLRIEGREGASNVDVDGVACASRRSDLDEIELRAGRVGDRVVIEAIIGESRRSLPRRLNLDIVVPADVPLRVEDRSGEIEISHVASVEVVDSSGEIEIHDVTGDVRVEDRSGDISLRRIAGSVRVHDGSGDIEIEDVGSVLIDRDGSGDLQIERVVGEVEIRRDGSGDIDVLTVGGDLRIDSAGSGDLDYDHVRGNVDVPRRRR